MFSVSPYEYQGGANGSIGNSNANTNVQVEESIKKLGMNNEGIKSIIMLNSGTSKHVNLDALANKRRWEIEKRGTLISADASRLY